MTCLEVIVFMRSLSFNKGGTEGKRGWIRINDQQGKEGETNEYEEPIFEQNVDMMFPVGGRKQSGESNKVCIE